MIPKEELKQYLDESIRYWRRMLYDKTPSAIPHPFKNKGECQCYIDAFQSMRKRFFGEILPL